MNHFVTSSYLKKIKYQELDHSCNKRINLHDEFKYIYGYLDINRRESVQFDYLSNAPLYNNANMLEQFANIICNFIYKTALDNF